MIGFHKSSVLVVRFAAPRFLLQDKTFLVLAIYPLRRSSIIYSVFGVLRTRKGKTHFTTNAAQGERQIALAYTLYNNPPCYTNVIYNA